MTFALAERYVRGMPAVPAPDLWPLRPALGSPPVALGALLRRVALWCRTSAPHPQPRQRMRACLVDHRDLLRTSLGTAAYINEVLRGADEVDVFVLSVLLECDRDFGLEPAARRRLLQAAEEAVFKRFTSSLKRKETFEEGAFDFRSFEFDVVAQLATATGLDAHRFEQTFLGFAADGYCRSLASEVYEHERSRAIYFVAIAALVASRTDDAVLLEAVRRCLKRLHDQRFGGAQLLATDIANTVRKEAGLDFAHVLVCCSLLCGS